MTVGELKQHLYELSEAGQINEDTEIRLAQQPRWAFEYATGFGIATSNHAEAAAPQVAEALYLEEGHQIGYLPEGVAQQLEW
ncbi:hypothetical protein CL634_00320 [bacterium]|nr:hypothetical protein [bacterium]